MNKTKEKVNAAIVIIGNEILSGRTQDVNVATISKWLNELGVKLEEVRVIPDIENSIIKTVNELRKKFKYTFHIPPLLINKYNSRVKKKIIP